MKTWQKVKNLKDLKRGDVITHQSDNGAPTFIVDLALDGAVVAVNTTVISKSDGWQVLKKVSGTKIKGTKKQKL